MRLAGQADPASSLPPVPSHPAAAVDEESIIRVASDRARTTRRLLLILGGSLLLHLAVLPFGEFRADVLVMARWSERLATEPRDDFYSRRGIIDHLPGDLWLLWALGHVFHWIHPHRAVGGVTFLWMIKLVTTLADLGIAAMLFAIARRLAGPTAGLRAAAWFALNPAAIFLAVYWAQWDALSALIVLVAFWLQLWRGPGWSLPVLAYAVLIKPQVVVLVPFFLLHHLATRSRSGATGRPQLRSLLAALVAPAAGGFVALGLVWVTCHPFDVGLPLPGLGARWSLTERMGYALDAYPRTTLNAFNIWAIAAARNLTTGDFVRDTAPLVAGLTAQRIGTVLFGLAVLAILAAYARRRDERTLIWAALVVSFAAFLLPTRIHERYLFPAVVFAALAAGLAPRLGLFAAALTVGYGLNLVWVYDYYYPLPVPEWVRTAPLIVAGSVLNMLLFCAALVWGWRALAGSSPGAQGVNGILARPLPDGASGNVRWSQSDAVRRSVDVVVHRWEGISLAGVVTLSAVLGFVRLGREGDSNLYYAAAVKSMLTSWHAFFFVSFDSGGFVSVDKPPLGLWVQAASAFLLGFHGWSLLLPQALAGVASVWLIHRVVGRAFGPVAGLVAALTLAVTPINVATDRTNALDGLLVPMLLLAAWAASVAAERGTLRPLLLAALGLGLGFNIKMLEAFLALPACALIYVVAAPRRRGTRLAHLALAGGVLAVVAFLWAAAVDLTPAADRPYVGSSTDNSERELILGHNGLDRLLPGAPAFRHGGQTVTVSMTRSVSQGGAGPRGPFRIVDVQLGPEAGWLLPLALLGGLAATVAAGPLRRRPDRRQAGLLLWETWFLTAAAFFSVANYFHAYYLVVQTPATAALVGAGLPALWGLFRGRGRAGWLLPLALAATAALQWHLLDEVWNGTRWLTILGVGSGAIAAALLADRRLAGPARAGGSGVVALGMAGLLLAPMVWSAYPVWQGLADPAFPTSGPQHPHLRAVTAPTAADRNLVDFLESHRDGARFLVATLDARQAAPLELATDAPIMAIGGYSGADPILNVPRLAAMIRRNDVRYVLLAGQIGIVHDLTNSLLHRGGASIVQWVANSCTEVPRAAWQGGGVQAASRGTVRAAGVRRAGLAGLNDLYDCSEAGVPGTIDSRAGPITPVATPAAQRDPWERVREMG